jgi:hypothetical protein
VLAEKLQNVQAKNKTLAALLSSSNEVRSNNVAYRPGADTLKIIYDGTPPGSLSRKLIEDLYSSKVTETWVDMDTTYHEDFVRELLFSVLKKHAPVPNTMDGRNIAPYTEEKTQQGNW